MIHQRRNSLSFHRISLSWCSCSLHYASVSMLCKGKVKFDNRAPCSIKVAGHLAAIAHCFEVWSENRWGVVQLGLLTIHSGNLILRVLLPTDTRVQEQLFDSNQLQKLSISFDRLTLYKPLRIDSKPRPQITPLPLGYHLSARFPPFFLT
jgi:hypothetical protein